MLQQSRPVIRRLFEPIRPVNRNPFVEKIWGPISPLERNPQSPKGWKNRESNGIGLGIVVALEKLDGRKGPENFTVGTPIKCVSSPISIDCPRDELGGNWRCCGDSGLDCHDYKDSGLFFGHPTRLAGDLRAFRPADFLSYCYLCRKELHGKDIYMYRGEKAFCSMECRYQQITSDEFQEKCGSEALRSSEISQTPYADDRLFFMGITAS